MLDIQCSAAWQVEATLLDLHGRQLKTISALSWVNAGRMRAVIETSGWSQGTHFVRSVVGGQVSKRKLMVEP